MEDVWTCGWGGDANGGPLGLSGTTSYNVPTSIYSKTTIKNFYQLLKKIRSSIPVSLVIYMTDLALIQIGLPAPGHDAPAAQMLL